MRTHSLMKRILLFAIIFSSFIFTSHASIQDFNKRFELVRGDNGELVEVRDRMFVESVSILSYLNFMKQQITDHLNSRDAEFAEVQADQVMEMFYSQSDDPALRAGELEWMRPIVEDSITALKNFDLNQLFKNRKSKQVFQRFENELNRKWSLMGLGVIARPADSQFFYKRNVGYEAVKFGLNLAKRMLSSVPILNFASQFIVEYEKIVRERRIYHQNMFLHYIENYDAKELGMTKEEVDHAVSSLYEARIAWFNIFESQKAVAQWDRYGFDIFYAQVRMANQILILRPDFYDSLGNRINFAFQDANVKGKKVILNLFNKAHQFSQRPAVAYYYEQPKRIQTERALLEFVKVGMSLVTIPDFIKDIARGYINSMYKAHKLTEGALVAHLEETKNSGLKKQIIKQNLNPFIR